MGNQLYPQTKQARETISFKSFHLKDLTDAEVENIIVQHSQSAPRESTIFEYEKSFQKKQSNDMKFHSVDGWVRTESK